MKNKLYTLYILLVMWLVTSCGKEPVPDLPQGELVQVEFKFGIPSQQSSLKTYSITNTDENTIKQIILLAFKVSGVSETFEYYRTGMQIFSGSAVNEKSFYTRLPKSGDTYRFVLIVNGGDDLTDMADNIAVGTEKNLVIEQLVQDVAGKWNVTSSADFTPLPMWGESPQVPGIYAQTVLPSVKLLRALARIDIKLDGDALTNFSITSVNIYDANNKVRMAPVSANYDDVTNLVSAPSIPAGTSATLDFVYDGFGQVTALEREIYLAEAEAGTTRIVIGGIFDTDPDPTYYEAVLNTALLRNNKYVINITKVNASGESLPGNVLSVQGGETGDSNRIRLKSGGLSSRVSVMPDK